MNSEVYDPNNDNQVQWSQRCQAKSHEVTRSIPNNRKITRCSFSCSDLKLSSDETSQNKPQVGSLPHCDNSADTKCIGRGSGLSNQPYEVEVKKRCRYVELIRPHIRHGIALLVGQPAMRTRLPPCNEQQIYFFLDGTHTHTHTRRPFAHTILSCEILLCTVSQNVVHGLAVAHQWRYCVSMTVGRFCYSPAIVLSFICCHGLGLS